MTHSGNVCVNTILKLDVMIAALEACRTEMVKSLRVRMNTECKLLLVSAEVTG